MANRKFRSFPSEGDRYGSHRGTIIIRSDYWNTKRKLFTQCLNCDEVLYKHPFLTEKGAHSAKELERGLDLPSNTLHYHLDTLVDVGLVENRKRKQSDSDRLYWYYRATSLGGGILEHGVRELMREEWDHLDAYSD